MPLRRPRRVEGFSYRGLHRYLLTFCSKNKRDVFVQQAVFDSAFREVQQVADQQRFAVLAYCYMPDHVHLVVEGLADDSDLPEFVRTAKQRAAYAVWKDHKLSKLWQDGYHDWVLRPDQSVTDVIRYVLNNPVRAGLVKEWQEYPFSGTKYPVEWIDGSRRP